MKKLLALLAALAVLSLTGCGSQPEATQAPAEEPTVEVTTEATEPTETEPPVPETESAVIKADRTAVMLTTANRGDILDVVDEYDGDHYVVKLENGYGLVEKRLARLDSDPAYEQWTGYAFYGAELYTNYLLRGEDPVKLDMNKQMTVLDSLGDVLVVQIEDSIGYILASQVSSYFIVPSPGGGGGGGGVDGGDIALNFRGSVALLGTFVPQEGEKTGTATVLADETPILLGWFDRDDKAELVLEEGFAEDREGYYTVYLDGIYGYIRQNLVSRESEEAYEEWDGYALYNAELYDNYDLTGESMRKLNANEEIHIVSDLVDCYLVIVGEETGYMAKDQISEYYVVYGGGSSGGGGGAEWSPPVL